MSTSLHNTGRCLSGIAGVYSLLRSISSLISCEQQHVCVVLRVSSTPKTSTSRKQQRALGKRHRDSQLIQPTAALVQEEVFSVFCEICDAELGVQDADEVFHFHSVFPSTA